MTIKIKPMTRRDSADLLAMGFEFVQPLSRGFQQWRLVQNRDAADVDVLALSMIAREGRSTLTIDYSA